MVSLSNGPELGIATIVPCSSSAANTVPVFSKFDAKTIIKQMIVFVISFTFS